MWVQWGGETPPDRLCPQVQVRVLPIPQRDPARADLPLECLQRDPGVSRAGWGYRVEKLIAVPRDTSSSTHTSLSPKGSGRSGRSLTTRSKACGCGMETLATPEAGRARWGQDGDSLRDWKAGLVAGAGIISGLDGWAGAGHGIGWSEAFPHLLSIPTGGAHLWPTEPLGTCVRAQYM